MSEQATSAGAARQDPVARRLTYWLTHILRVVSAHWLLGANLLLALYVGLPVLAPVLAHLGYERGAGLIHLVYRPFCHQLPERSFFLFGPQMTYTYAELSAWLGGAVVPPRWAGEAGIGFKTAFCQRDVAIYGSMLLFGMVFGLVRRHVPVLALKWFLLMLAPMTVDGTGQLVGLWTSTWLTRVVTGAIFGLGCVWLAFPHLERGMAEVRAEAENTLRNWGI